MKMEEIQKEILTMNKGQLDTLIQSVITRKNSLTNEFICLEIVLCFCKFKDKQIFSFNVKLFLHL